MLIIHDGCFKDEHGRRRLLRGVNLGGSSKVPCTPDGATWRREGFFQHRHVSFVGRPFPLAEADRHFDRLRSWGLSFLRLLVTWEAVEHEGPGIYDEAYLDYLAALVAKAGEHGLGLFIDPHQDVWSRFSGGDGAPGWTFEAVGMDIARFQATGAALTHQEHGDPLPRMIWPTNMGKLASATMFTLFFAGNDFAPQLKVDGEPVQEYLQRHYIAAMQQVAGRLQGMAHVVGYDTLNEPSRGYIGCADLNAPSGELRMGACPTPYQSMLLGAGYPQQVETWELRLTGMRRAGEQLLNPGRERAWLPGFDCLWKQHGVWDVDAAGTPHLLRPDYFLQVNGRSVDFNNDYLRPFANRYAAAIRQFEPGALIFVETEPHTRLPEWGVDDADRIVSAPHWYDGLTLVMKANNPWLAYDIAARRLVFGPWAVRRSFARHVRQLQQASRQRMRGAPTLIGEFGIPFDLQGKSAYRTGDFSAQVRAMGRSLRAMDEALASWTLWNYTSDNTNARGDQWNDEDFSVFSPDQQDDPSDLNSGGRALQALVRPYASRVAGEPLAMSFNVRRRQFFFKFRHDPQVSASTEFFIPNYQYPRGYLVSVSDGTWQADPQEQKLVYAHTDTHDDHWIKIKPK